MFKKVIMLGISALMLLGACGNGEVISERDTSKGSSPDNEDISASIIPDSKSNNNEETDINSDSSVLIAYFSWSGNTKQLADVIQEQIGGELFEIEPETPYTDDINELSGIALQEQCNNARPPLNSIVADMSQYDVIFTGS